MYMMKARKFILPMVAVGSILLIGACNSEKIAALPDPPASAKQVEALVKEKKFSVKELGFYGALTVNDKTEMEWIDTTQEPNSMVKNVYKEVVNWEIHFGKDSSGTVVSDGSPYASRWWVDDQPDSEETPGIRIRCSYTDPKFSFGTAEPMEITFSYLVKGINENQLLLELPRDINRRKLIALMQLKP
jgi:hypothetical protein